MTHIRQQLVVLYPLKKTQQQKKIYFSKNIPYAWFKVLKQVVSSLQFNKNESGHMAELVKGLFITFRPLLTFC